nr:hypothetical protein [Mesorhizobium sp. CA16]
MRYEVRTPLGPPEWRVTYTNGGPTVVPSIGNWQLPRRSHSVITGGKVLWAGQWSEENINAGRIAEQHRGETYYAARPHNRKWWVRFGKWLRGLFSGGRN